MFHMGGLKMHRNDQSYKSFIAWIQDYARVAGNEYTSVDQLPDDNWHATKRVLRLMHCPDDWEVGTPVQLFVHAWNGTADAWETDPMAFTQGTVTPRRIVNGALFLLARHGEQSQQEWESSSFERGKYLVKAYVDSRGLLAKDPALLLDEEDFIGQVELKDARWREGFPKAEKASFHHIENR